MTATQPTPTHRNAAACACVALAVIALGLASRRHPGLFPAALGKYPGDALWALMMFLLWGMLWPRASTARVAVAALLTCYAVELSQLYQAPWIVAVRRTTLGHLVLGSAFHGLDLLAYAVGVLFGSVGECASFRWMRRWPEPRATVAPDPITHVESSEGNTSP